MPKEYKIIVSQNLSSPHLMWDWCAVTDDYDGENDDPIGYGSTPSEAVELLMDQIAEMEA